MSKAAKASAILVTVLFVIGLAAQLSFQYSFASPALLGQGNAPRAPGAPNTAFSLFLPFFSKPPTPPPPYYLPAIASGRPNTPTPTPTTAPPSSNPVLNPGFEQDNPDGPWYASVTYSCSNPPCQAIGVDVRANASKLSSAGVTPHGGSYAAWLGQFAPGQEDLLQGNISIPAGASTLSYWAWIKTTEPTCDAVNVNGVWVKFLQESGQPTLESYAICTTTATSGWVKHTINITGYRGQTLWLAFTARVLNSNGNLFIDDVTIN